MSAKAQSCLGAFALLISALWIGIASLSLLPALPYNPLSESPAASMVSRMILPQGWAFFTRSPREDRYTVLAPSGGRWEPAPCGVLAEPCNGFGVHREARALGVDMGTLSSSIDESDWTTCGSDLDTCLNEAGITLHRTNEAKRPVLCGDLAVLFWEPVPWAWAGKVNEREMPKRFARFDVDCPALETEEFFDA